ncbi:MAG: phospholipase D-like domain-containing protein [Candidatus Nitrosocosmicus sp.]|nr:phospholipase D-like domain-containing protein [Candidatus Nitrosocosmicus sp.]MDN5867760.1 phospholipase D-like domain-containing protein [Candidatus Nitrosocosmicus sp.]
MTVAGDNNPHIFTEQSSSLVFGEKTFDNSATFTIDGNETFRLMHDMISKAESNICIISYDLDPQVHLIRSATTQQQSPSVNFRSEINNQEVDRQRSHHEELFKENYILENLLIQKAIEGVDIKMLVWEPKLLIRLFPGSASRGLGPRGKKLETIKSLAKKHGVENRISIRVDNMSPTYTSGFHEKIIIIDERVGFCGGFDLMNDKWDTNSHDCDNPLRDDNYSPWHDIHAMVTGQIVRDLIVHFNQRWTYSLTKNINSARDSKMTINLAKKQYFPFDENNEGNDVEIQAFRTWKDLENNKDRDYISAIYSWYALIFQRAKNSIYIEDQFPFQNNSITHVLGEQLKQEQNLKVIIVGPMKPNLPQSLLSIISKESIKDIDNNLSYLRKIGGERVKTYSLVSQDPSIPQRRRQIYVHSKLLISDDNWIKIGSANMDKKGFRDSVEFDLGITSPKLAQEIRIRLWKEHLNQNSQNSHSKTDLHNFEEGFNYWITMADDNGRRVQNNEPIQGHIYYYNFEEVNLPSPYLNAK